MVKVKLGSSQEMTSVSNPCVSISMIGGMGKCVTNAASITDWPHLVASSTYNNEANQWYKRL